MPRIPTEIVRALSWIAVVGVVGLVVLVFILAYSL
jgi:hypothetical protein